MEIASNIMPLSLVVADKEYDSEANHEFVRELDAVSIIPARYEVIYPKTLQYIMIDAMLTNPK